MVKKHMVVTERCYTPKSHEKPGNIFLRLFDDESNKYDYSQILYSDSLDNIGGPAREAILANVGDMLLVEFVVGIYNEDIKDGRIVGIQNLTGEKNAQKLWDEARKLAKQRGIDIPEKKR
jgi:hypothetical protein